MVITVQLYVANVPIRYVLASARPFMLGATAWEGQGFEAAGPVESSVILRGSVDGKAALAQLQTGVADLLRAFGERSAFVELWDGSKPLGAMSWEAAPPARANVA